MQFYLRQWILSITSGVTQAACVLTGGLWNKEDLQFDLRSNVPYGRCRAIGQAGWGIEYGVQRMAFEQHQSEQKLFQPDLMSQNSISNQLALEAWSPSGKGHSDIQEAFVMANAEHTTKDQIANGDMPALGTYERLDYMIKNGQMFDSRGRITADGGRAIEEYARNGSVNFQSFNPFAGFDGSDQRLRYARNLINESGQHRAFGRHHSKIDRIGLGVPIGIYVSCGTSTYAP